MTTTAGMPASFKAGPYTFRITRDAAQVPGGVGLDDKVGVACLIEQVVWIEPGIPISAAREVLLHELMHVAVWASGAKGPLQTAALAWTPGGDNHDDPEEVYVGAISTNLMSILKINPALRRFLWP